MKKLLVLIAFGTLAGCSLYFGNDTPGSSGGGGGGGGGGGTGYGCTSNTDCAAGCYCAPGSGSGSAASGTCTEGGFCTTDADCGTGFHCDTSRSSCEPNPPGNPAGSCDGKVTCTTAPPVCPAGQVAGESNGCWSGMCEAVATCDVHPPCDLNQHEADCLADQTCGATYTGEDCTKPDGSACHDGDANCTCAKFVYATCVDKTAGN
jgi:hypothetical protein